MGGVDSFFPPFVPFVLELKWFVPRGLPLWPLQMDVLRVILRVTDIVGQLMAVTKMFLDLYFVLSMCTKIRQ